MNTFIFLLDSPFLIEAAREAEAIGETVMLDPDAPEKFRLCRDAARKMLAMEAVSKQEVTGLLDSIGGYYASTKLYCEKHTTGDDGVERMKHAEEMLRFARKIQELVRPVWGLELVK
jgi:hypothetical protein